jgi:NAD(P)-dependent dehydrogenase (short-subunit alcohol dehydrogenase family)
MAKATGLGSGLGRLVGRAAIVTGGARGIGKAICEAYAAEGAAVWIADLHGGEAEELATKLRESGAEAGGGYCDVRSFDNVRDVVDAAADTFGHLDILVGNAATLTPAATIEDLEESDWTQALAVNVTGAFHLCKHGLPHLKRNGGGSIILTASQMGRVGNAGSAAYCTTKGALIQLAKTMALDHADDNIRVNTLSPGGTATERLFGRYGSPEGAEKGWGVTMHPLGRLGRPEEMAKGAVFLASEESSFMTGADLLLDGGYSAR